MQLEQKLRRKFVAILLLHGKGIFFQSKGLRSFVRTFKSDRGCKYVYGDFAHSVCRLLGSRQRIARIL